MTAPADGVAPTPVVNILVGHIALQRILARRGMGIEPEAPHPDDLLTDLIIERMESSTGVTLAPDDVIAACLTGVVRRVVIDSASVVVDACRKRRLFTGGRRPPDRSRPPIITRSGTGCSPIGRPYAPGTDDSTARTCVRSQRLTAPRA